MRASKGAGARQPRPTRVVSKLHPTHTSNPQLLWRCSSKCSSRTVSCVPTAGMRCTTSMHTTPTQNLSVKHQHAATQRPNPVTPASAVLASHTRSQLPVRLRTAAAAADTTSSSSSSSSESSAPRAVIVGGGPSGLAAAIGLAKQSGFSVDVFDSRPHPTGDSQAAREALLVALGARGLLALCDLDISLTPTQSHTSLRSSSAMPSRTSSPAPGEKSESRPSTPSSHTTSPITNLVGGLKPPTGLTMLQGMVVQGPRGRKQVETYVKPKQQGPEGIAVMDSYTLTTSLLSEATAAATPTRAAAASATPLPLTLTADTYTSATFDASAAAAAAAAQSGKTPLSTTGAAAATSAEEAQAGALPAVIQAPSAPGAGQTSEGQSLTGGQMTAGESLTGQSEGSGAGVRCHYSCELLMVDTANRQATFIGQDGEALVVPYDLLIGAEHEAGTHLVGEALAEIHHRDYAHKHPGSSSSGSVKPAAAAAAALPDTQLAAAAAVQEGAQQQQQPEQLAGLPAAAKAAAKAAGFVELEVKSWHDMPHQQALKGLLPKGVDHLSDSMDEVGQHHHQGPGQGWLLVWAGSSGTGKAAPFPSTGAIDGTSGDTATWSVSGTSGDTKKHSGSGTVLLPGGPSCSLMAWPSRGGGSWSGAVFTAPQVFESLRSQSDYEGLLKGLRSSSGDLLPGLWIKGIAAQLKGRADRVGRVMAPFLPPPPHLAAAAAGLTLLSPAACLTGSPQLLCPTVSLGLQDAAVLAAAVAAAVGKRKAQASSSSSSGASGEELHRRIEQGLKHYDRMRQPQVAALQKLQAQLSYLRHPFSPAAAAALAAIPPFTLPWMTGLFGHSRLGLAFQWRSFVAVLPLIAAVTRVLKGLGFGHHASKAVQHPSTGGTTVSSSSAGGATSGAAAAAAVTLADILHTVKPSGASFMAYLHTTAVPFTTLRHLLHAAPLLLAAVCAVGIWAAAEAVRWGVWAWQVWGISWAGA